MILLVSWAELWPTLLIAFGITYIVTGSTIGYWFRMIWCALLQWCAFTRYWWPVMTCPPCNAFYSGALVGLLVTGSMLKAFEIAIIHLGVVGLLQTFLGGNGIAPTDEDFEEILGLTGEEDGTESES